MRKSVALLALPLAAIGVAAVPFGASAAPHTPKLTGGVEHLYIASTSANGNAQELIVTGAVTDYGHTGGGQNSPGHLSKGRWFVRTGGLKQKLLSMSAANCWFRAESFGPLVITGGTGAYVGIHGTLQYSETFVGIGVRKPNGTCNESNNAPDLATIASGSAVGTIMF